MTETEYRLLDELRSARGMVKAVVGVCSGVRPTKVLLCLPDLTVPLTCVFYEFAED